MKKKQSSSVEPSAAAPTGTATAAVRPLYQGSFDTCGPTITGWLFDKNNPGESCEVEVRVDGIPVGRATAELFRIDLLESNIGDGLCGFQLALPEVLFDGVEHVVELREATTGFLLPGSPRTILLGGATHTEIRLENGALRGSARIKGGVSSRDLEVIDLETGKTIAGGISEANDSGSGELRFSIPLPAAVFDGRPHAFSVRTRDDATLLRDIAVIMPYVATPESALLQYSRHGMTPALATAAGFRYESLAASVGRLTKDAPQSKGKDAAAGAHSLAEQVEQLSRVHAKLVRGFDPKDRDFDVLTFPVVADPAVSIVIPVHNKFHITYHCLASLLLAPSKATFEVILVDDGSTDITVKAPDLLKNVRHVRNDESKGFIRSCNRGAALSRGKYVVMLNNDTEVTPNWLDELIWPFEHFANVGMTGAKLLYADGTLQEAGGIVWKTGNPWNYGRNGNARDPRYNYSRQVDYLSGACLMLPTTVWKEIGGFSETYLPAYFEDTDLAFQVRDKGLKTVYAPMCQVFHFEGMSSGTDVSTGTKRFQEINRPKFKARWTTACRDNGREGVDVELNKDRNVEMRALVIDAQMPMPDQDAGSYAAIQEIRLLQALGFKCTFVPQNMAWMGHYTNDLQRMGVECAYAPFYSSINQVLEQRGEEFDLVYITRYYIAQNYTDLVRKYAPRAKLVLMNADLHFLRELRAAIHTKNSADMTKSLKTRDEELAVMRKVDLVLSYTDVEKAVILSHNLDSTKVAKCPWVTELATSVPGFKDRKDIAFLGGFNHYPNVQAVQWFVTQVFPQLRRALPDVRLKIFGSHMPDHLAKLIEVEEGVDVVGWVPTVQEVYDQCRLFIAPLQSGAGIKGKVIGALAHGVPSVLSPVAAEGIPVVDGTDGMLAEKPEEWVAAIAKLYNSEKLWGKMSIAAIELARRQFGFEGGVLQMRRALQEAELFTNDVNGALVSRI